MSHTDENEIETNEEATEDGEESIGNILNDIGEGAAEGEDEQDSSEDPEEEADKTEDDVKGDKKKAEAPAAKDKKKEADDSDDEEEPEGGWTKKAYLEEKRKRQALEKELKEGKGEKTEEVKKKERPDVFEDPDGFIKHTEENFNTEIFKTRVELSTEMLNDKHGEEKVKEMFEVFNELADKNPQLGIQLTKVANPAKFAFTEAEKYLNSKKFEDPNYEKNLEAKLRKQILAELKEESEGDEPEEEDEGDEPESKPAAKAKKKEIEVPDLINTNSAKKKNNAPSLPSLDEIFPD